ncbi:unnamed protein product [Nippostrongylus brasiliensis]|uniref:Phosphomannomutase n=1 Tax=Nippostrongylus brasiliensis TaxID=27835 RepID=A0A0N4Y3X7_NIPBR|nr:unnamed protein product [Nippostrongylus brasiliensis]
MTRTVLVFDVDGTLTPARQKIHEDMRQFMMKVREHVPVAVVGGSDLVKIVEQLANSEEELLSQYDYVFSENGLVGFKGTEKYPTRAIQDHIGEDRLQQGMLNLSPIGRSCSQSERDQFVVYDEKHKIREKFVKALEENFADFGLCFVIGGQISVDVYPEGWDKTYCLQYIEKDFDVIHFFGDKTMPGGNDYAIFTDPRTIGHTVTDPADTKLQLEQLLKEIKT